MKHLNPRQGITTLDVVAADDAPDALRVKHLNPRQGITTCTTIDGDTRPVAISRCETPKSPPGDYNLFQVGLP